MNAEVLPEGPEIQAFVENFVVAVDFQTQVPVDAKTALSSLPEWDSLAALGVIVMCDTEYGVSITGNDLKASVTVGDVFMRVMAKKNG